MITCPWCGTNYVTFQSNCQNCGGPLPAPVEDQSPGLEAGFPGSSLQTPPPAPRPIGSRYAWRLMASDGWAIAALVFGLLGAVFSVVGVALTLGVVTAFLGIPFAAFGILFLVGGAAAAAWRYQEAQKSVEVLRSGEAVEGIITQVEINPHVRINGRNPWLIRYQFRANGQAYEGSVSTLNSPGPALQAGQRAYVLYLAQAPERNVLYPHP